ncbi:hypothetical protein NDU88_005345 [Pleurodeles waltl]|uniref:Uncharacterized protein n=1 Tax=Pleurodeles waltl TaxID=8319 RepID=A0AAV7PIA6_PLEWA|nr:hypothetical protein NDU88_005345 [Pleurodeles waltl]
MEVKEDAERQQQKERDDAREEEDMEMKEDADWEENGAAEEDRERSVYRRRQRGKPGAGKDETTEAKKDRDQHREEPDTGRPRHVPGGTWLHKV